MLLSVWDDFGMHGFRKRQAHRRPKGWMQRNPALGVEQLPSCGIGVFGDPDRYHFGVIRGSPISKMD